jgi:hypothetical protein
MKIAVELIYCRPEAGKFIVGICIKISLLIV